MRLFRQFQGEVRRIHLPRLYEKWFSEWYFATLARMRKSYPTDLSDAEWKYIEPHLPAPKGHGRPRTHSLREILNAIFYLLKSGCQWRLLPHDFPRWPTVYHYFRNGASMVPGRGSTELIRERLRVRLKQGPSAQRGRGGFPVCKEHRGGRGRARLRWWQEGQGQKAPHPGGHRGLRAQGARSTARRSWITRGSRRYCAKRTSGSLASRHLWLDAGYRGEDKGADWVQQGPGLERGCGGASEEARPRRGADEVGCGVGQRGRGGGLAEAICPPKASWCSLAGGW